MGRYLLGLSLFLCAANTQAQPDSLIQVPESWGSKVIIRVFDHYLKPNRVDSGIQLLQQMSAAYGREGKPILQQNAWVFAQVLAGSKIEDLEAKISMLDKQSAWALKKGWPSAATQLQFFIGTACYDSGLKGKGFEYLLRAYGKLEQMDPASMPLLYYYAHHLASIYYNLGDFENSVRFVGTYENTDTALLPEADRFGFRNSMGLAFMQLKKYDSADAFLAKAHHASSLRGDTMWMALIHGNLGASLWEQGRLNEALPLLQNDYATSLQYGNRSSAVNAGLLMARIYLARQELAALAQIMSAIDTLMPSAESAATRQQYFELKFQLAQRQGRWQLAAAMADSAIWYHSSADKDRNNALSLRIRNKLETENYLNSIATLQAQKDTEIMLRNALLALVVTGTMVVLLFINRYRIKKQKEADAAYYARQIAEDKLQLVKSELDQYTLRMKEKAALTQRLQEEIEALRQEHQQVSAERENVLQQLLQATILTEEDWTTFRELFEKVHPGFLVRLRQTFPDLTPAETRLLVLTKLQLSNKEMTAMLGIGYDAIKKTRQRLRKKIDLPEDGGLEDLIQQI